MFSNLKTIVHGMCMGVAEAVPGVSGSTIALVLGIYDKFVDILYSASHFAQEVALFCIRRSSKEKVIASFQKIPLLYAIQLFAGMTISIVVLAKGIGYSLDTYPQYTIAVFFGLVLASIPFPWMQVEKKNISRICIAICSAIATFFLLSFQPTTLTDNVNPLYVFFGGAIAICAMILPGISGSFILLLLGLYEYILEQVEKAIMFDTSAVLTLIVFGAGIGVGFLSFVRLLKYLLKTHKDILMSVLTGLMVGSLRTLWPYFTIENDVKTFVLPDVFTFSELVLIVCCAILGVCLVYGLQYIGDKSTHEKK